MDFMISACCFIILSCSVVFYGFLPAVVEFV